LSLLGQRAGLKPHLLNDYACSNSFIKCKRAGLFFYVHRGLWKFALPLAENIEEVFLVNLEHRVDRLNRFYDSHPYLKPIINRTNAVYGNKLKLDSGLVRLFRDNDFKWKKGVMGCALSHYEIWKDLDNCQYSKSRLILEDDVVLDADFMKIWRSMAHLMPIDADIIFLGGVLPPNKAALPSYTEPVNSAFARIREATFGSVKRRYFHFCTYSYIIRKSGAKKLCKLIEEKGIFTSIDHMLVNHTDLLNIYFTTPLLATCFQDTDPNYINADFNNFDRVDKFDSEIWNNVEQFNKEEILAATCSDIQFIYFEENQKNCIEQQWLEEIFDCSIKWVPSGEEVEKNTKVVLYYQHTTPVSVIEGWINRHLDCFIVLFHASDEACNADVSLYKHTAVKTVFRNYWRPECISEKVIHLPLGYLNDSRGTGSRLRKYTWSFAGAMDRKGRLEHISELKSLVPNYKLHCTPTWNSKENLGKAEYSQLLQESKIVPCLTGFFNVESYRFYEAVENGAIPIIPLDEKNSYTNIFSGSLNPPLLSLADMNMLGKVIGVLEKNNAVIERIAKDTCDWWYGYKLYLKKLIRSRLA
jgi:GR25 family glycosyltransferase involved in LPS biosynthesis